MRIALTATLVLTLVVILVVAAPETIAQVRAALVKNVDEPGLNPFSQSFVLSTNACSCTNCCFISTDTVPAGKRLVIQNVSGWFPLSSAANAGYIHLSQGDSGGSTVINTIPPTFRTQWNGGDYPAYEFNQNTMAFVDAGKQARVAIFSSASFGSRSGTLTINGYFVNLQ
jgi:hypothetical protein